MTMNWLRHLELQLLNESGEGIDLSSFGVSFDINSFDISSKVRTGQFRIYNLSAQTANRIISGKTYSRVRLRAGYDGVTGLKGSYGEIFSGDILYAIAGKSSAQDSYVLIQVADSHLAFTSAMSHRTVAAGYRPVDINHLLMKDFSPYGITEGRTPTMPTTVFPRGRVLLGMTRDLMDNVAAQCNARWTFINGKREMLAEEEYVHEVIVLNSETGMLGTPTQTQTGVTVSCLINPNIQLNGLIQVDESSITRLELDQKAPGLSTDGVYIVRGMSCSGNTYATDSKWMMTLSCEARQAQ